MGFQQVLSGGPFFSSVETDMEPGNVAQDGEGSWYVKCKSVGTINVNELVKASGVPATSERGFDVPSVALSTAIIEGPLVVGVNEAGAIAQDDFFWCKVGPVMNCLGVTTGSVAAGVVVYPSATNGEVDDDATGELGAVGVSITATSGAGTAIKVLRIPS